MVLNNNFLKEDLKQNNLSGDFVFDVVVVRVEKISKNDLNYELKNVVRIQVKKVLGVVVMSNFNNDVN